MEFTKLDSSAEVVQAILNPSGQPRLFTVTLSEFENIYEEITKRRDSTKVDIVLNGTWALVQFSELVNHRIRVVPNNAHRRMMRFWWGRQFLEKQDFKIAHTSTTFYGQTEYLTFSRFALEEIRSNGLTALVLITASFYLINLAAEAATPAESVISAASDVILAVGAIFFSMFLLFTASQNLSLVNIELFKRGLTHRFMQIDANVTYLAIVTLGVAGATRVLSTFPDLDTRVVIVLLSTTINWLHIAIAGTALAITLMAISLITVVQYYFKRLQYLYETEYSRKVLDEQFQKRTQS